MFNGIDQLLRRHSAIPYVAIVASLIVITLVDYYTGTEFSSFTLYLVPIGIACWYTTRHFAVVAVLVSAISWLMCEQLSGREYTSLLAPYWNALLRLVTFAIVANLITTVRRSMSALKAIAMRDGLTQLNNARAFRSKYDYVRALAARRHSPLSIAVIDLDGFKQVNDSKGHAIGDEVLRAFAHVLSDSSRTADVVARMGGDEFMVILVDAGESAARAYEARVRKTLQDSGLAQDHGIEFSMGIMTFDAPPVDVSKAIGSADALMYKAKYEGKARTVFRHVSATELQNG